MSEQKKIAILGAGAIGSVFGCLLAGGGHSKEIDSMTGYAVEVGYRLKVPVGVNEGLMYLIKSMEGR
jgi:ketopantoate reductase